MADNIIFEREFTRGESGNTFFVSLQSETDSPLASVNPISVVVSEAFSYASPIVTATFTDGYGIYFNAVKMDTEQTYWLALGNDRIKDVTRIPLKISKVSLKNTVSGKSDQIAFKVSFVHYGWNELINTRMNRGWANKKYSDIIRDIATECGYDLINIAPSRHVYETTIQPYWSNLSFIRWIQDRAIPEKFDDHYEFGCKLNNEFFFKSMSTIISDKKSDILNKNIPTINLGGYDFNEAQRKREKEENFNVPPYFTDFSATEHYMDSVINGAGGVRTMHYDFNTGDFVSTPVKLSESNSLQLTDFTSLKQTNESSDLRLFCGRDTNSVSFGKSKVSSVSLSMNQFQITTEGSIDIHIGDVVELIIHTDGQVLKNAYSMMYGGFYVVSSVTHMIPLDDVNMFLSVINLANTGINGKELEGYTTTALGKFV